MMDIEDIQSDLQALRKLYGLLKSDEYSLHNENYEVLDHKARLLLRNLLDAAAERVFKAHSEIVAARHGSFHTACSTQQGQSKEMMKLQPHPVLTNVPNNFASVVQSTSKDLHTQKTVMGKDEWGPTEPASQVVSSEQYGLKIFSSQPEVRKKRCRVCQRSKAKQLKSSDEPKPMDWVTSNPDRSIGVLHQLNKPFQFGQGDVLEKGLMSSHKALQTDNFTETQPRTGSFEFQSNRNEIEHSMCSSNKPAVAIGGSGALQGLAAEVVWKPEEADRISKEASFKIQQIESRISDLQVAAKPASPLQIQFGAHYEQCESMSSSDLGAESVSSLQQTKRRLLTRNELGQVGSFVAGRNDLKLRPVSEKVWEPTQWHQESYQSGDTEMSNQVISRNSELLPPTAAMRSRTTGQNAWRNKGMKFEYDRLSEVGKPSEEYKLTRQNDNHVPGKNVRAIIDRIESVSDELGSQDDDMAGETNKFVQRSRVAANANKTVTTDIIMPAKVQRWMEKEYFDRHRTGLKKTNGFGNVGISQPSTPSVRSKFSRLQLVDTGSELSRTRTKAETRLPNRTITRQNLLDYKPRQHRVSPSMYEDQLEKDQGSVHKKNHHFDPRRLISPSQELSQSTGPRSCYSSSSTSQQVVSTSFSDDEGYSVSGESQTRHFSGSSTSIESKVYSRHGRKVGPKVSRSSSDSEIYSVSSRSRGYQSDSSSNGESQDYQSSDETLTPHHKGPSYQSGGSATRRMLMDKKQRPGRLKKLKDKLAIIFHHHHHHHHHHHGHGDDDTDSGQHVVVRGGKALWKHAGKILDKSKEEAYGEEAVKKIRKSADKNQRGHFHALVEGLLQHIRHSKKSKPPKGGGLGRPGSGGKKAATKLHWWQMLRRQRGLKMPKKPSGKGRVGRKNPKLKALPKPR